MTFMKLDTTIMPEGLPWVKIGIGRTSASAHGKPQISIRLSRSLYEYIGLTDDNFVSVEIGRDEDEGMLRISAIDHDGLTPERKSTASRAFRFSAYRLGVVEKHKTEKLKNYRVQPKIESGIHVIDIELPDWAGGLTLAETRERGRHVDS
jgi:hypothetical protein